MKIEEMRDELTKRLASMEAERDALRELESEVTDHADRMESACDSLRKAIDCLNRLFE